MANLTRNVVVTLRRRNLLRPGDRVAVAVSGGADSVALMRLFLELREELGLVLSVAHLHHGIRGDEADADMAFVRDLAIRHSLDFHRERADVPQFARNRRLSLETAARELRYDFFRRIISSGAVDKVATAHTLDDQAETVLMRLVRGTGPAGLAGILPLIEVPGGAIIRPLLETRRSEIEAYLNEISQPWCEDSTNSAVEHTRNRVRHALLPLLEREFNPSVRERLAELAEITRAEEEVWRERLDLLRAPDWPLWKTLPVALQRRTARAWAKDATGLCLEFDKVEALRALASGEIRGTLELSEGFCAERHGSSIRFFRQLPASERVQSTDYEAVLPIPGEVFVPATSTRFRAESVRQAEVAASDVLPASLAGRHLIVRNWRPGDRFWPAHTRSAKKVKELLAEKHITGADRPLWPVALLDGEIIWLRGFPVAHRFAAELDSGGFRISVDAPPAE